MMFETALIWEMWWHTDLQNELSSSSIFLLQHPGVEQLDAARNRVSKPIWPPALASDDLRRIWAPSNRENAQETISFLKTNATRQLKTTKAKPKGSDIIKNYGGKKKGTCVTSWIRFWSILIIDWIDSSLSANHHPSGHPQRFSASSASRRRRSCHIPQHPLWGQIICWEYGIFVGKNMFSSQEII